jgi:hypothetical protein
MVVVVTEEQIVAPAVRLVMVEPADRLARAQADRLARLADEVEPAGQPVRARAARLARPARPADEVEPAGRLARAQAARLAAGPVE